MNVSDTLLLPSFEGATVTAGEAGLGREVSTAMIVEAPDIDVWGKPGQMLVTSFYAFENLSAAGLTAFFEKADELGIGAIVFKPERLLAEAPKRVVELCDEHAIPLVKIPAETKYEALLLDVLGNFLDSNLTLLNRFFDLHRQTMDLALRKPTVLEILLKLRGLIHADLTFFDSTKDRRTTTSQELSSFTTPRLRELPEDKYRTHRYFDATLVYPELTRHATAVLIPSSDDQIYYLIAHVKAERLSPLDIMAVENVVSLLQMEILKQNALDRKIFFQNNNLMRELLTEPSGDGARTESILKTLGIHAYPHYEVMTVKFTLDDPAEVDRREDVINMARRRIKTLYPDTAYLEMNDSIAFLHNVRATPARYDGATVTSIMKDVAQVAAMPKFTHLVAISSLGSASELPKLMRETGDIVRFFDGKQYRDSLLRFEDLGIYKLFMQVTDASELMSFVDPRVRKLRETSAELFETAQVLCENSLNYQETARQLYMHPKTIRYRAERVRKLTGLDFHNPDDRLQISLGGRIYQLLENKR